MGSVIGDVVFAVFAVVGLYFLISRLTDWLARRISPATGKQAVKRCVVYIWPENDAEHAESVLRGLEGLCPKISAEYVIVLDGLNSEVRDICCLFAQEQKNVRTAECFM